MKDVISVKIDDKGKATKLKSFAIFIWKKENKIEKINVNKLKIINFFDIIFIIANNSEIDYNKSVYR